MEETPQIIESLTIQPDEPDGEAAGVGFGRDCAISVGGPMIVLVLNTGVQEPEAFAVFGMLGQRLLFSELHWPQVQ